MEKLVLEDKDRNAVYAKLEAITSLDNVYCKEEVEEARLFKSAKYRLLVVKKEDIKNYIREYLIHVGELMGIEIHPEIREEEGILNIGVISNNSPILIGREGKNIDALQTLLRQTLKNKVGLPIKMNLDASDYKLKKQKRLEREVKNIAREVLKTKIDAKLDPMNAYDRRIVHSVISNYEDLKTESVGEAPNRYVTIKYMGN